MATNENESALPVGVCHWCGEEYRSEHRSKLYCSAQCRNDFGNFMQVVGKRIAATAMGWRRARGSKDKGGAAAFQQLCTLLDEANAEFVAARPKRAPSINEYLAARNGTPLLIGKDRFRRG